MKIKVILAVLLFGMISSYAQVTVIANKSVSESSIDASKLAAVYDLIQKKWDNGSKVVVFDLKSPEDVKNTFYKYIKRDPNNLRKEWMKAQLTGEAIAPKVLRSEEEMLAEIASTSGAIGFVSSAKVNDQVKVLLTIE